MSRIASALGLSQARLTGLGIATALSVVGAPAIAADFGAPGPQPVFADPLATPGTDAIVTLGGGVRVAPAWDGSSRYVASPMPIIGLKFLRSPLTGQPTSDTGFGIRPTFRFLDERKGTGDLAGLNKVSNAYEIGAQVDYTDTYWRAYVELRQGFGGHHGLLGDIGAEAIVRPMPGLKLAVGPRVSLASSEYMTRYFGVTPAETVASGGKFATFTPSAGFRAVGVTAQATYDITPNWIARADVGYDRLVGDAAKSPIVKQAGDANQFSVGLGVAYRFGIGWH